MIDNRGTEVPNPGHSEVCNLARRARGTLAFAVGPRPANVRVSAAAAKHVHARVNATGLGNVYKIYCRAADER